MKTLKERLWNGCSILGNFWKIPEERCAHGWSTLPCSCDPLKKFCKARLQWFKLALEDGREVSYEDHGLILMMTTKEWEATGLVMKIETPGVGAYSIGEDGVMSMKEYAGFEHSPESLECILKVMKTFPDSKLESVLSNSNESHSGTPRK